MSKVFTSPIVLVVALALLVYGGVRLVQVWQIYHELKLRETKLEERVASSEAQNQELREEIRVARTPEAIERDAKARLNLKKPGEEVVVVVGTSPAATTSQGASGGLLSRLKTFFYSLFGR